LGSPVDALCPKISTPVLYPEDIAEAVAFFASARSSKSTGNIVNVDAGNPAAFTR